MWWGKHLGQGGVSMVVPSRAGILAQTEARSGDEAQQRLEACLVCGDVYNQPYYITFCHAYKIAKHLHMYSFKMLIFKGLGGNGGRACILQEMPVHKVEKGKLNITSPSLQLLY